MPIAVVIPTHDTRELTLECLASLERGELRPEQVIVVDDASGDGTGQAIAERHPGVVVLRNDQVSGFSAAANRGLAAARADILLLLNSDTEVAADCLARFARAFHRHDRLGVAGAALFDPDGTPQWSGGPRPSTAWLFAASSGIGRLASALGRRSGADSRHSRSVDWVAGAALAMRREVWERYGPLDERFTLYCQDMDLCLRAGEGGWEVQVLPGCRVLHHHGATIAQTAGDAQDLEKLWCDLVRWAAKAGSGASARRAARVLRTGGLLRSLALRVANSLNRGPSRARLRQRIVAVERARRAVRALLP